MSQVPAHPLSQKEKWARTDTYTPGLGHRRTKRGPRICLGFGRQPEPPLMALSSVTHVLPIPHGIVPTVCIY